MDFAGFAWQPFLSNTQMEKLETVQNKALKIATGVYRNSPQEARRAEVGLDSYETQSNRAALIAREKAIRLPTDHPRRIAFSSTHPPKKITKTDWRHK